MSYHHYRVSGIVLKREERGENDAVYVVLTGTFGLIAVHAKGIRTMASKLRLSLQVGTHVDLALVRGKSGWRVTYATTLYVPPMKVKVSLQRVYKIIRTHVVFDEVLDHVYRSLCALLYLDNKIVEHLETHKVAEILTYGRVLWSLGLLDIDDPIMHSYELSYEVCGRYSMNADALLIHIRERLGEGTV